MERARIEKRESSPLRARWRCFADSAGGRGLGRRYGGGGSAGACGRGRRDDTGSRRLPVAALHPVRRPGLTDAAVPCRLRDRASDEDTFSKTPHWPGVEEPKKLHASLLGRMTDPALPSHGPIDVTCALLERRRRRLPDAGTADTLHRRGDEAQSSAVRLHRRQRAEHQGRARRRLRQGLPGGDACLVDLGQGRLGAGADDAPVAPAARQRRQRGEALLHSPAPGGVEYALVSLHVSSRQNPNWVWGTFEHAMNPGRCDSMGCWTASARRSPSSCRTSRRSTRSTAPARRRRRSRRG